MIWEFFTF